jgi:RNA polymerase sigma factor (sigma-70 family)
VADGADGRDEPRHAPSGGAPGGDRAESNARTSAGTSGTGAGAPHSDSAAGSTRSRSTGSDGAELKHAASDGRAVHEHSADSDDPDVEEDAERTGASDAELITAVRNGHVESYEPLYERHVAAARNLARQVGRSAAEADDLVSEAFAKVLDSLRGGGGPDQAFRAYLLTTLRRTAYDRSRRERRIQLADDVAEVSGADLSVPFTDTAVAGLERSLVEQAFGRLPERWRSVLWHVEVEGEAPSEVAPLFGLTPNGVSALAYRAREGLRQAYLQAHLGQLDGEELHSCRGVVDRLGAWARSGLSRRERVQVNAHLDTCPRCRQLASELAEVNGDLRALIAPVVLGVGAVGYFSGGSTAAGTGAAAGAGAAHASHAAGAVPKQATTSGVSAGALGIAIAVALTGASQPKPVAASPPPPPPPVLQPPPRPAPPAPPAPHHPATPPPVSNLNGTGPAQPVSLVPGGPAVDLPITVRNSGNGPSGPVAVTLSTPPGVTANIPGASGGGSGPRSFNTGAAEPSGSAATTTPMSSHRSGATPGTTSAVADGPIGALQTAAPAASDPGVTCAPGTGATTCTLNPGLPPGGSHTFHFRVQASQDARGGQITGRLSSGGSNGSVSGLQLAAVPVLIVPTDGVQLKASGEDYAPSAFTELDVDVRNTGNHPGLAITTATLPAGVRVKSLPEECELAPDDRRQLRCAAQLQPGQTFEGEVWLEQQCDQGPDWPFDRGGRWMTVPVSTRLGTATDGSTVRVRHERSWHDGPRDPDDPARPPTSPPSDPPVREEPSDGP